MALVLKDCTLMGNMLSDKTDEQYPEEPACTACIKSELARGEDSRIVTVGDFNADPDAACYFCDEER